MEVLLDDVVYNGPQQYNSSDIANIPDLFRRRAALLYTPTEELPSDEIGSGPIEITLPFAFPTIFDVDQNAGCWGPRMWLDLAQRATGKIRWKPIVPARIKIVRYDNTTYGVQNLMGGTKGLIDCLKASSTGRSDGRLLYYFGAILDDNHIDLPSIKIDQQLVDHSSMSKTTVIVTPAQSS